MHLNEAFFSRFFTYQANADSSSRVLSTQFSLNHHHLPGFVCSNLPGFLEKLRMWVGQTATHTMELKVQDIRHVYI